MPTCFIHVGQHKTGTSAIQAFLRDNRDGFARHGVLVPKSGVTGAGSHQVLVRDMLGTPVPPGQQGARHRFEAELAGHSGDVVLSAELMETLLTRSADPNAMIGFLRDRGFDVRLVLYLRNQPQLFNSAYAQRVKTFCYAGEFVPTVEQKLRQPSSGYATWLEVADRNRCELIARPFTGRVRAGGLVADFLSAIGLSLSEFSAPNPGHRVNESVGPCAIAVARRIMRRLEDSGTTLTRMQSGKCKKALLRSVARLGLDEPTYSGLDTALARRIETTVKQDNDRFARAVWKVDWAEVFADDVGRSYEVNDFARVGMSADDESRFARLFERVWAKTQDILADPAFRREGDWNELGKLKAARA